jgi:hypothetical protein
VTLPSRGKFSSSVFGELLLRQDAPKAAQAFRDDDGCCGSARL